MFIDLFICFEIVRLSKIDIYNDIYIYTDIYIYIVFEIYWFTDTTCGGGYLYTQVCLGGI